MHPLRVSLFALLFLAVLGLSQEAEALNQVPQLHNIDKVWQEQGIYGEGVTIAILDTGIDNDHVSLDDMDDNQFTNDWKVVAYYDAVQDTLVCSPCFPGESIDSGSHGTHVAGIVAGTGAGDTASDGTPHIGVAPNAKLVNVLVCCDDFEDILRGMEWVTSNKDEFDINVALIAVSIEDQFVLSDSNISAFQNASRSLIESGIVLVGPTGNEFGGITAPYSSVGVLGSINEVVTVGALDKYKNLAPYSAMGPTDYGIIKPNVVAVGGHISAPDAGSGDGYTTKSGTSMSVAVVAGISALIIEANPDVTPNEIRIILETTSEYRWSNNQVRPNNEYGWGIVDAYNAVNSAGLLSEFKHIAPSHSTQGSMYIVNYTKLETEGWNLTPMRYQVVVGTGIYFDMLNTDEQIVCNLEIDFSKVVEGSDYCEENAYFFFEPGNFSLIVRMQIGDSYTLPFYFQVEVIELPDLYISTIDFSHGNPSEGDVVTINATIKLLKMNVTDNFEVTFYLDEISNTTVIGTVGINGTSLEWGIENQHFVSVNWKAINGNHTIYVVVDSTDIIYESEENNSFSKVILVGSDEGIPGFGFAVAIMSVGLIARARGEI